VRVETAKKRGQDTQSLGAKWALLSEAEKDEYLTTRDVAELTTFTSTPIPKEATPCGIGDAVYPISCDELGNLPECIALRSLRALCTGASRFHCFCVQHISIRLIDIVSSYRVFWFMFVEF